MNAETPFARCQAQQAGMGDIQTTIQVREVSHSQGEPKSDRHLAHTVNHNDSRLPNLPALCYLDVLSEQNPDMTANSRTIFHVSLLCSPMVTNGNHERIHLSSEEFAKAGGVPYNPPLASM